MFASATYRIIVVPVVLVAVGIIVVPLVLVAVGIAVVTARLGGASPVLQGRDSRLSGVATRTATVNVGG